MTKPEKVIVGPTTGHDIGCSCNMYGCRDTNTITIRISTLLIRLCGTRQASNGRYQGHA